MASEETAETFGNYIAGMTMSAFTSLSVMMGHRLGIFKLFGTFDAPKTISEIANIGGFKERYLQEWLGSMVTARIVEYDSHRKAFSIPPHRQEALSGFGPVMAGFLPHCASGTDPVEKCFLKDGPAGAEHSEYNQGMDRFMEDIDNFLYTKDFVNGILEKVPGLQDQLDDGISMLELGCNIGKVALMLGSMYPKSKILGIDLREDPLSIAKSRADKAGLKNVDFKAHDIIKMPKDWTDKWDFILAMDVIHDIGSPSTALKQICRVLKPGGHAAILDINMHTDLKDNLADPKASMVYSFSLLSCMTMSLAQEGGEAVGAAWGKEKAVSLMKAAGFKTVDIAQETPFQALYICMK